MTTLTEGRLTFTFDDDCDVGKYDDWSYYRQYFQSAAGSSKAVDFVCVSKRVAWLIEVKDYRFHPRTKLIELSDEIAAKVRDTLAGLATAATNAHDVHEKKIAQRALCSRRRWRIALHLEQPVQNSKLWQGVPDPTKLLPKLKKKLKFVDPDPEIVDTSRSCSDMNWTST